MILLGRLLVCHDRAYQNQSKRAWRNAGREVYRHGWMPQTVVYDHANETECRVLSSHVLVRVQVVVGMIVGVPKLIFAIR